MSQFFRLTTGTCVAVCLCGLGIATEDPVIPPPDVETLVAAKDSPGDAVMLTWTDGTAPFAIVRSTSPDFLNPTDLNYVSRGTPLSTISDPVLTDGETYYYLVQDVNAPTQVYKISNTNPVPYEGDVLTIDGIGFSDTCADNAFYLEGGLAATLTTCSSTQIQAEVPVHASEKALCRGY